MNNTKLDRQLADFGQAMHDLWAHGANKEVVADRAARLVSLWNGGVQHRLTAVFARGWRAWLARKLLGL